MAGDWPVSKKPLGVRALKRPLQALDRLDLITYSPERLHGILYNPSIQPTFTDRVLKQFSDVLVTIQSLVECSTYEDNCL